jgi:hypothetical protein
MNQQEINLRYIPREQPIAAPPTSADVTSLKHKIVATRPGKWLRSVWHFLQRARNRLRPGELQRQFLLVQRLALLPVAYGTSLVLIVYLKLKVGAKKDSINPLHFGAIEYFVDLA